MPEDTLVALRASTSPAKTLWELVTASGKASDDQILQALAKRTRLKLADLSKPDPRVKEVVPESVARRYRIVPLRVTDSYLEVAGANPFDLDAEKALAFATGREVRVLLASPTRIAAGID